MHTGLGSVCYVVPGQTVALHARSLEANGGLLSNIEVVQVLKDRGADTTGPNSKAKPSERVVYEALTTTQAGQTSAHKTRENLQAFMEAIKVFSLTKAEVLQILNLVPKTPVEVHLLVEDCEERLDEDQVAALLEAVQQHLVQ